MTIRLSSWLAWVAAANIKSLHTDRTASPPAATFIFIYLVMYGFLSQPYMVWLRKWMVKPLSDHQQQNCDNDPTIVVVDHCIWFYLQIISWFPLIWILRLAPRHYVTANDCGISVFVVTVVASQRQARHCIWQSVHSTTLTWTTTLWQSVHSTLSWMAIYSVSLWQSALSLTFCVTSHFHEIEGFSYSINSHHPSVTAFP